MTEYNTLYLYRHTPTNSRFSKLYEEPAYFWTMCSADTEYCRQYREREQTRRCGKILEEIGTMTCRSAEACKKLQLAINQAFKAWTRGGGMKIYLDIPCSDFFRHCSDIAVGIAGVDNILDTYGHKEVDGTVYLARCANGKLKIGITTNLDSRKENLKQEERNQATDILDTFKSYDIAADEARLHALCAGYKANGNGTVRYLQDCGNSELFTECAEVMNIWNKYKEGIKNG